MTKRGRPKKGPKRLAVAHAHPKPKPFEVALTASAETTYLALRELSLKAETRDGNATSQHCTTFRMVDEAIRTLIPADPTHTKYALHAPLERVYRIAKGRMRIAWIVDARHRQVLILYISDTARKEGDAQDPYRVLTALMKSGHLNAIIEDWQKTLEVPPDAPVQ
jgi:hypothetical protein